MFITKKDLKADASNTKQATKAIDLKPFLDQIRDEQDLLKKKEIAIKMAEHFAVGGRDKFVQSISAARTVADVDRIAYMAALKGEGLSSKRF